MADLLLLITLLVAVGALFALIRLCDRIVGDDPPRPAPATPTTSASTTDEVGP